MNINELIEQIGGRERLQQLADDNTICRVSWDERIAMARALLAVLDVKPVGYFRNDARAVFRVWPTASDDCNNPAYTTPPAASVPDVNFDLSKPGTEATVITHYQVPEGWKLVPIEPSKEMLLASKRYKAKTKVPTGPGVYRAMIAAAPAPGGDGG